jgi:hypothetical protein
MDLTEGSETSANINQTPGNHPKVDILKKKFYFKERQTSSGAQTAPCCVVIAVYFIGGKAAGV